MPEQWAQKLSLFQKYDYDLIGFSLKVEANKHFLAKENIYKPSINIDWNRLDKDYHGVTDLLEIVPEQSVTRCITTIFESYRRPDLQHIHLAIAHVLEYRKRIYPKQLITLLLVCVFVGYQFIRIVYDKWNYGKEFHNHSKCVYVINCIKHINRNNKHFCCLVYDTWTD